MRPLLAALPLLATVPSLAQAAMQINPVLAAPLPLAQTGEHIINPKDTSVYQLVIILKAPPHRDWRLETVPAMRFKCTTIGVIPHVYDLMPEPKNHAFPRERRCIAQVRANTKFTLVGSIYLIKNPSFTETKINLGCRIVGEKNQPCTLVMTADRTHDFRELY